MKSRVFFYITLFTLFLSAFSCDNDPEIPNEEELITTLTYTLTPVGGGDPLTLSFRDLDGDGGQTPVITADTLIAGTQYDGSIKLLNESITPADSITSEIEMEDEDHQFFFAVTGVDASIEYADMDSQGYPIGLRTTLTTITAGTGSITVILRHLADKSAPGVSDGIIDNAGGETDIEVTLPLVIQ